MEIIKKNIIPVIVLLLVYTVPFFFDNRLLNVNTIQRFLFSTITLVLAVSLLFSTIKEFYVPQLRMMITFVVLFLVFILISSYVNERIVLSTEEIAIYVNIFLFSYLIFLVFRLMDFKKLLTLIAYSSSLICLLVAIFGILEYFDINILGFKVNTRPGSTLGVRNFAAEYSIAAVPYLMVIGFNSKHIAAKIYSAASSFIILVFIFFCRTRSSLIVLVLYLVLIFVFLYKNKFFNDGRYKKYFAYTVFIVIMAGAAGSINAPKMDKARLSLGSTAISAFDKNLPENSARINYTKTALRMFRDEPFLGIGAGSWFGIYPKYNSTIYNDANVFATSELNPHNDFLQILSENGIFGLIFFFLILLTAAKYLIWDTRNDFTYLPVFLSFTGYLVISLFSFPKDNIAAVILFSTALGTAFAEKGTEIKKDYFKFDQKYVKFIIIIPVIIVMLFLVFLGYFRYKSEITYLRALNDKAAGNKSAAIEKFESINTVLFPADANCMPVDFYKGTVYFDMQKYKEAEECFEKALILTPNAPVILNNIAAAIYRQNRNEEATKMFYEMRKRFPFFLEPQINLLAIYTNAKKDSLAKILLEDIGRRSAGNSKIRNFDVFEKIRDYYNEKDSL